MLANKIKLIILLSLFNLFGYCQENIVKKEQNTTEGKTKLIKQNCFILRPIRNNMEPISTLELSTIKTKNISSYVQYLIKKNDIRITNQSAYIMNFDTQQKIVVNKDCFELMQKDSVDLSYLYFTTLGETNEAPSTKVYLEKIFQLNIAGIGETFILQYRFGAASMVEHARMYLILKEPNSESYERDYTGFVLRADYVDWNIETSYGVVPIHLTLLRNNIEIHTPLFFEKDQFIPIDYIIVKNND